MILFRAWTLLLMAVITLFMKRACAHTREVEEAELKEEFSDDFDDATAIPSLGGVEQHLKFELEHQMAIDAPFTPRGVVDIVISASSPKPKISFSDLPILSDNDVEKLKMLLHSGSHYTVRAKADLSDPNSRYVMTSVPMCMLVAMRLREDFAFHLSDSGKLVAIEYLTPYVDAVTCAEHQTSSLKDVRFGPFGSVLKAQIGPSPPKNIVVKRDRAPQGVEPVKSEDGNDEAEEESQSFLRKYWYIVLPIVVMSLFGGGGAEPAGAAGGAPATPTAGGRRQ
ncbi:hypothetical protein KXD40_008333 [Peronospora effusa]|uniref:ER membrane protein complex subunit 10 n=1 Tax=Peronospora effusa TaxID=542832 RepID=A0A3R7XBV0_9STRA|nr:hypothetical protein DD237_006597 [Peronospora effusa]UIZ23952.1 hypothetical protein KXD40_008333 [Peronospora effusa]CAI5711034.1 unnamed protein product [Peronospora effusa]